MKNWWSKQSQPNKRSWKLLGFLALLVSSTFLLRVIAPEYMTIPMVVIFGAIIIGTPFYLFWEIYRSYTKTKELSDYGHLSFYSGVGIMILTSLIWIGALIFLLFSDVSDVQGVPFGMFILPVLLLGAIGQSLTKRAFRDIKEDA